MKHITFGDKSLLVGDDATDALLEYAAYLTSASQGVTVEMHAISSGGDEVTATFLLGPGVTMMAETAHTSLPEPDNTTALAYMKQAQTMPTVSSALETHHELAAWDYDDI